MARQRTAVKKSVTIAPDVLTELSSERTRNLSATVNESLRLIAVLDAQQALVDEWELEHGPFDEEELRPFLEAALRAQMKNTMRILGDHRRSIS